VCVRVLRRPLAVSQEPIFANHSSRIGSAFPIGPATRRCVVRLARFGQSLPRLMPRIVPSPATVRLTALKLHSGRVGVSCQKNRTISCRSA
jgi:hypothetical protein